MKITSKKKSFSQAAADFVNNNSGYSFGALLREKVRRVRRDFKEMTISPNERLILKRPNHIEKMHKFFLYMKGANPKTFSVVPIKDIKVKVPESGYTPVVQKYFRRPTINMLLLYFELLRKRKEIVDIHGSLNKLPAYEKQELRRSLIAPEAGGYLRSPWKMSSQDIKYCRDLLKANPKMTELMIHNVHAELWQLWLDEPHTMYRDNFYEDGRPHRFEFRASNFLVFGIDKKTNKLKIGIIDL